MISGVFAENIAGFFYFADSGVNFFLFFFFGGLDLFGIGVYLYQKQGVTPRKERNEEMKIREMFKKVEAYNELAEIMNGGKAHVWFAEKSVITIGDAFKDYNEFRKYIRREYFKDVEDFILNSDEWEINSEKTFTNNFGNEMTFEVYIEQY